MSIKLATLGTLASLAALQASSASVGGIIRHDRAPDRYERLAQEEPFQCVGKATVAVSPDQQQPFYGSAVLIAPQWVLTVAHFANDKPIENQRYLFAEKEYRAVRVIASPGSGGKKGAKRKQNDLSADGDLALVQLDRTVEDVQPATRYRAMDEVGQIMTKVGYGCIGDGETGIALPPRQRRRAGNNVIDSVGGQFQKMTVSKHILTCDFDDPNDSESNQLGSPQPLDLEIGLSVGDSGGGWFVHDKGSWKLVAITSRFLPNRGEPRTVNTPKYGAVIAGMRISTANKWIDSVIDERLTKERPTGKPKR